MRRDLGECRTTAGSSNKIDPAEPRRRSKSIKSFERSHPLGRNGIIRTTRLMTGFVEQRLRDSEDIERARRSWTKTYDIEKCQEDPGDLPSPLKKSLRVPPLLRRPPGVGRPRSAEQIARSLDRKFGASRRRRAGTSGDPGSRRTYWVPCGGCPGVHQATSTPSSCWTRSQNRIRYRGDPTPPCSNAALSELLLPTL